MFNRKFNLLFLKTTKIEMSIEGDIERRILYPFFLCNEFDFNELFCLLVSRRHSFTLHMSFQLNMSCHCSVSTVRVERCVYVRGFEDPPSGLLKIITRSNSSTHKYIIYFSMPVEHIKY